MRNIFELFWIPLNSRRWKNVWWCTAIKRKFLANELLQQNKCVWRNAHAIQQRQSAWLDQKLMCWYRRTTFLGFFRPLSAHLQNKFVCTNFHFPKYTMQIHANAYQKLCTQIRTKREMKNLIYIFYLHFVNYANEK